MASFASSATTCGARKHAWTNTRAATATTLVLNLTMEYTSPYKLSYSQVMSLMRLNCRIRRDSSVDFLLGFVSRII